MTGCEFVGSKRQLLFQAPIIIVNSAIQTYVGNGLPWSDKGKYHVARTTSK